MKNKFIKSTLILIIGGFITKLLGMLTKIVLTRTITTEGIGIYMLIMPTFNLFITLCTFGLPIAISKLVSERKNSSKKLLFSSIPIIFIINIILIITLIVIAPFIANNLLKNNDTYYSLLAIGLTLPFISISALIKGYFFGKEKMFPSTLSNIIEQITRLVLTVILVPNYFKYGINIAITVVVLINIVSEFTSIIILLLFIPKNKKISKYDIKFNKPIIRELLDISIPTTGSRLIGSFVYFLEPIILTYCLLKVGYPNDFITYEYGIINGYVYPLVLLPSFFTLAISNSILPIISNYTSNRNNRSACIKINQAIIFSLIIGIPVTIIFMIVPELPLKLIYNTNEGINYIKVIAPFFLLYYIQSPLTSCMQAMGKAKDAMIGTIIGSIIKITSLFLTSYLKIGLWCLIISTISNIIFVTIHHIYCVSKYFKKL